MCLKEVHQNCKQNIHHEQDSVNHPWICLLESFNLGLSLQRESSAKSIGNMRGMESKNETKH